MCSYLEKKLKFNIQSLVTNCTYRVQSQYVKISLYLYWKRMPNTFYLAGLLDQKWKKNFYSNKLKIKKVILPIFVPLVLLLTVDRINFFVILSFAILGTCPLFHARPHCPTFPFCTSYSLLIFTTQSRIIGAVRGAHSQLWETTIHVFSQYAPRKYDKRFGTPAIVWFTGRN